MALPKIFEKFKQYLPLSGGSMTGPIVLSQDADTLCRKVVDNGAIHLSGAAAFRNGGALALYGKDAVLHTGGFLLQTAFVDGKPKEFIGLPSGRLAWCGKEIESVNSSGENYIRYENGLQIVFAAIPLNSSQTVTSFPVPFDVSKTYPRVSMISLNTNGYPIAQGVTGTSLTFIVRRAGTGTSNVDSGSVEYIAIGFWK